MKLHELALQAMLEAEGNIDHAAQGLCAMILGDSTLFDSIAQPILLRACRDECRKLNQGIRDIVTKPAGSDDRRHQAARSYIAAARQDVATLLDFPLHDGTALRSARRAQIYASVNAYGQQASTMLQRRQWLKLVGDALPDEKKTVADVLTEEKLQQFWIQAEGLMRQR